jgi:hypothetical protein
VRLEDLRRDGRGRLLVHRQDRHHHRPGEAIAAKRWLALLFGLGLALRLLALPQPGMVDVKAWKAWGLLAAERGLAEVYGPPDRELLERWRATGTVPRTQTVFRGEVYVVDYPPGSMLLLWAAATLYRALDPAETLGRLYTVLLNLLPFAAALGIARVLARSAPDTLGAARALAFWCNPALLLAAVLGYQDPVMALAALGAVLALGAGRPVAATLLLAAAGMLKPQASLLLPSFLALLALECPRRRWPKVALAGAAVAVVVLSPWWAQGRLLSALAGSLMPLGEHFASSQSLNLWWLVGYVVQWAHEGAWPLTRILTTDAFTALAGFSPLWPSRLLLIAGTLANLWLLLRRPASDPARLPLAVILQTHVYAACATGVHENHSLLAVVMAPLLLGVWEKARAVVALTSAFLFANLFLLEGLGRGVLRDRWLWRLRLATGVDLTVLVAAAHLALVVVLFVWAARRPIPSPVSR